MSQITFPVYAVPIRRLLDESNIPEQFLSIEDGRGKLLDRIFFTNYSVFGGPELIGVKIDLIVLGEASLKFSGLDSLALVVGSESAGVTSIKASFYLGKSGFGARLDDVVTVSRDAAEVGESSIYLKKGDRLTVRELVEAALVQSANDEFGPADALRQAFEKFGQPKQLQFIEASDHFFAGALHHLEDAIAAHKPHHTRDIVAVEGLIEL